MKFTINNLLGAKRVEFDALRQRVTEIVGLNNSGKSSTLTAVQALVSQSVDPLGVGVSKQQFYANSETSDDPTATLDLDEDRVSWRPITNEITSDCDPLSCPEAAGRIDFLAKRSAKERAAMLQSVLLPSEDEILEQLEKRLSSMATMDERTRKGIVDEVATNGWESSQSVYHDRALQSKRRWASIAGESWGAKKAADWVPEGWLEAYYSRSTSECEAEINVARDELNALHAAAAVERHSQAEIDAAKADLEAMLDDNDLTKRLDSAGLVRTNYQLIMDEKTTAYEEASRRGYDEPPTRPKRSYCPHCTGAVIVHDDGELEIFHEDRADERFAEELEAHKKAQDTLKKARDEMKEAQKAFHDADDKWRQLEQDDRFRQREIAALQDLADREADEVDAESTERAIRAGEETVENAKRVLRMVEARQETQQLNESILAYQSVDKLLGAEGLRSTLVAERLATMNKGLARVSDRTDGAWGLVTVTERGDIAYNGRPAAMTSRSEQWRTQASLQLVFAMMSDSQVVLLDECDMLDPQNTIAMRKVLSAITARMQLAIIIASTHKPATYEPDSLPHNWSIINITDGKTS